MVSSLSQSGVSGSASLTSESRNEPNATQFLSLLTAQLTQQDPLEPMNNQEMMNQIIGIQNLESLSELKTSIGSLARSETMAAGELLGKTVELSVDGETVSGVVDGIRWAQGQAQLVVGGQTYPESTVLAVRQS